MKTNILICMLACLGMFQSFPQAGIMPNCELISLEGITVKSNIISNDGLPLLMVFWKSYENDCCQQLELLNKVNENFLKEKEVKLVAICSDCNGQVNQIKPILMGHDFDFEAYIDLNGEFKRRMGISETPHTILFDGNLKIVCEHLGFCSGVEDELCKKIDECLNKIAFN